MRRYHLRVTRSAALLLVLVLASASEAASSLSLVGRVVDQATRLPLGDAEIVLAGAETRAMTDAHGCFTLSVPADGRWTLHVSRDGYESADVDARPTARASASGSIGPIVKRATRWWSGCVQRHFAPASRSS